VCKGIFLLCVCVRVCACVCVCVYTRKFQQYLIASVLVHDDSSHVMYKWINKEMLEEDDVESAAPCESGIQFEEPFRLVPSQIVASDMKNVICLSQID